MKFLKRNHDLSSVISAELTIEIAMTEFLSPQVWQAISIIRRCKMRYILLISISFVLSACGIGGYWMNGNPSAGRNIKPYLHYWEKNGLTSEQRREDSWACGAGATVYGADHVAFSQKQAAAEKQMNEKDDIAARARLREIWRSCMADKRYRYAP